MRPDARLKIAFERGRGLVPVHSALQKFTGGQTLLHLIADDLRNHARAQLAAKKKQDPRMPKLEPIPLDELLSIPGLGQFVNVGCEFGTLECRTPLEQLANQNKSGVEDDL